MDKSKFLSKIFMICFSGIFFLMYLSRIGRDNLFIEGIVLLILLLLFYKVYNGKRFTIYLFIFSFMIRLGVILMNNVEPVSDFAVMYNAAQYIKDGGKNLQNFSGNYFRDWAYQTGVLLGSGKYYVKKDYVFLNAE